MSERRDTKRLAKRFGFTFVLVGVSVSSASLIGRDATQRESSPPTPLESAARSTTSSALVQTQPPAVVAAEASTTVDTEADRGPGRLPSPDLQAYCVSHFPGTIALGLNVESDFSCRTTDGGEGHDAHVDDACVEQFGVGSRQVVLTLTPLELRCVPRDPVEVGLPDFTSYCRTVFGADSIASSIDSSARGWRCGTIRNGMFETGDIDFDNHGVDLACQLPIGTEGYAVIIDEATSEGWRCYGLP